MFGAILDEIWTCWTQTGTFSDVFKLILNAHPRFLPLSPSKKAIAM